MVMNQECWSNLRIFVGFFLGGGEGRLSDLEGKCHSDESNSSSLCSGSSVEAMKSLFDPIKQSVCPDKVMSLYIR